MLAYQLSSHKHSCLVSCFVLRTRVDSEVNGAGNSPRLSQKCRSGLATSLPFRVGHGWDLHRLEEGKKLIIGGIDIPHTKGTIAHSDGDVVLHTITDAILGALCQPDIGQLFPDKDPKWKGSASDVFLLEAVRLMESKGYSLGNIDVTIIAERPKISPHKQKILENLYSLLKAPQETINLKAKTSEGVDALGENRAIACEAVVMLIRNDLIGGSMTASEVPQLH